MQMWIFFRCEIYFWRKDDETLSGVDPSLLISFLENLEDEEFVLENLVML